MPLSATRPNHPASPFYSEPHRQRNPQRDVRAVIGNTERAGEIQEQVLAQDNARPQFHHSDGRAGPRNFRPIRFGIPLECEAQAGGERNIRRDRQGRTGADTEDPTAIDLDPAEAVGEVVRVGEVSEKRDRIDRFDRRQPPRDPVKARTERWRVLREILAGRCGVAETPDQGWPRAILGGDLFPDRGRDVARP